MATIEFTVFIYVRERVEDSIRVEKIFDCGKHQYKNEQSRPKEHDEKIIQVPNKKERAFKHLNFVRNLREERKGMREQVFTTLSEPLVNLFPKLSDCVQDG